MAKIKKGRMVNDHAAGVNAAREAFDELLQKMPKHRSLASVLREISIFYHESGGYIELMNVKAGRGGYLPTMRAVDAMRLHLKKSERAKNRLKNQKLKTITA